MPDGPSLIFSYAAKTVPIAGIGPSAMQLNILYSKDLKNPQ
jgi:hypothetical protein